MSTYMESLREDVTRRGQVNPRFASLVERLRALPDPTNDRIDLSFRTTAQTLLDDWVERQERCPSQQQKRHTVMTPLSLCLLYQKLHVFDFWYFLPGVRDKEKCLFQHEFFRMSYVRLFKDMAAIRNHLDLSPSDLVRLFILCRPFFSTNEDDTQLYFRKLLEFFDLPNLMNTYWDRLKSLGLEIMLDEGIPPVLPELLNHPQFCLEFYRKLQQKRPALSHRPGQYLYPDVMFARTVARRIQNAKQFQYLVPLLSQQVNRQLVNTIQASRAPSPLQGRHLRQVGCAVVVELQQLKPSIILTQGKTWFRYRGRVGDKDQVFVDVRQLNPLDSEGWYLFVKAKSQVTNASWRELLDLEDDGRISKRNGSNGLIVSLSQPNLQEHPDVVLEHGRDLTQLLSITWPRKKKHRNLQWPFSRLSLHALPIDILPYLPRTVAGNRQERQQPEAVDCQRTLCFMLYNMLHESVHPMTVDTFYKQCMPLSVYPVLYRAWKRQPLMHARFTRRMALWHTGSIGLEVCEALMLTSNPTTHLLKYLADIFQPLESKKKEHVRVLLPVLIYMMDELQLSLREVDVTSHTMVTFGFLNFCFQLPPAFTKLKRALTHFLWHHSPMSGILNGNNIGEDSADSQAPEWSQVAKITRLEIDFNPMEELDDPHYLLPYDVNQHVFVTEFRRWIRPEVVGRKTRLRLLGEPAMGRAVYELVLQEHWQHVLQQRWLSMNDEGQVEIAPQLTRNQCIGVHSAMYFLGLVSSLAVRQGLYLPLPLTRELWQHLLCIASLEKPALLEAYRERIAHFETLGEFDTLKQLMGVGDDRSILNHGDLFLEVAGPDSATLAFFVLGWQSVTPAFAPASAVRSRSFWTRLDPNTLLVQANTAQAITPLAVAQAGVLNAPHPTLWSDFVMLLQPQELQQLVAFITGKKRLPCPEMGEPPLQVEFRPSNCYEAPSLPTSQNCFNVLRVNQVVQTASELYQHMSPIFKFSTCFGSA